PLCPRNCQGWGCNGLKNSTGVLLLDHCVQGTAKDGVVMDYQEQHWVLLLDHCVQVFLPRMGL
ncbi:hypothetical protein RRG08_018505, partial [Elysia crispata]